MCRTVEQLDVDVKEKQEKSKFISPFVKFTNRAKKNEGEEEAGRWAKELKVKKLQFGT